MITIVGSLNMDMVITTERVPVMGSKSKSVARRASIVLPAGTMNVPACGIGSTVLNIVVVPTRSVMPELPSGGSLGSTGSR